MRHFGLPELGHQASSDEQSDVEALVSFQR
jgi:hypothetical protein